MRSILRSGFTRHFISGFVLGAIGLVAVQTAEANDRPRSEWVASETVR